jgi:hypothetical protein
LDRRRQSYAAALQPGNPWLFPSPGAKGGHTVDVRKAFRRVVAAAGLDPDQILRHTLRHTAITHLVQAGVDLPTVKRISGHKTLSMVERYSHQNGSHIQAAMDKLQARLNLASQRPRKPGSSGAITQELHKPSMEWESLSFADTEDLRRAVAGKNVIGILSGHIHFDRVSHWHGIPVVVGIGQHAATDVLWLHEGLRMLSGASFAICTLRPSGLSITFAPQPSERRELHSFTFAGMAEMLKKYEASLVAAE